MRIDHLEYIIEIAKIGSISSAAKKLWIGATSLSAILRNVESELDTIIFTRTTRGLQLTESGACLLEQMKAVAEEYQSLLNMAGNSQKGKSFCTCSSYPALSPLIGPYLAEKISKHNTFHINVKNILSYKLLPAISDGIVDIGIATIQKNDLKSFVEYANKNNIAIENLASDRQCIAIRADSSCIEHSTINDLEELPQLQTCSATFFPRFTGSYSNVNYSHFAHYYTFEDIESVKKAVATTNMISILPALSFYKDHYVATKQIRLIPLLDKKYKLVNMLAYNKKEHYPKIMVETINAIHDFFAQIEG